MDQETEDQKTLDTPLDSQITVNDTGTSVETDAAKAGVHVLHRNVGKSNGQITGKPAWFEAAKCFIDLSKAGTVDIRFGAKSSIYWNGKGIQVSLPGQTANGGDDLVSGSEVLDQVHLIASADQQRLIDLTYPIADPDDGFRVHLA